MAAAAVFARWEAIPFHSPQHIAVFEETYGVEVGEPGAWFSAWALGDGQAYALIGVDPTGRVLAEEIGEAGYRFARAGYGWASWAVSLGQADLVPYGMAVVGALSVAGVLAMAVHLRGPLGPRAWLMILNPGLFIGFAADTSEPMAVLLLTIALGSGSWWAAGLLGMTRPTFLVTLWGNSRSLAVGVTGALALAAYSFVAFGADAMIPSGGRLGLPLHAYLEFPSVWGIALAIAAMATVVVGVRTRDLSWILAGVFVLCFGFGVLRDPANAWRAAGFLPVLWAFGTNYEQPRQYERALHQATADADVA